MPRRESRRRLLWVLSVALVAGGVAVSQRALADAVVLSLPIERYKLANGLTVALAPDPSLEETSFVVHYDVGSADDPPGKDGLAHLVEHLMFDGSRHVDQGEYYRWMNRAGASRFNGTTSIDSTNYFATIPSANLPLAFWLESDRMAFVAEHLNQQILDTEKRIVADEVRDRFLDRSLGAVGPEGWMQLFPPWHPYHRKQTSAFLVDCNLDDVRAFLRTWYVPSNATIGLAGRFDVSTVRALIERYFGDLPGGQPPPRPDLPSHWPAHDSRIDVGANVPHDTVSFLWRTPALYRPGDAALDLAAAILADPDGRLQHDLVSRGLAVSLSARESSFLRASVFWVSAVLADGVAVEEVVHTMENAIGDLGRLVRPEEYTRTRDEWFDTLMLRLGTSSGRASHLVRRQPLDSPWDLDKYDGMGPSEIASAIRSNLVPENRVVVVVHHDRRYPGTGVVLPAAGRSP